MRRAALLGALIALALATPAAAWRELPPYPIPHDGVADCLRAAGPGQLALLGQLGRTTSATDLLSVGPSGLTRTSSTTLGWLTACAEVGVAPGRPPLLAAPVARGAKHSETAMRAAVAGSAPATLASTTRADGSPTIAVAPNGAAVVAWQQAITDSSDPARLFAAVRPAATAPFGPPTMLGESPGSQPALAIDSAGVATVAWVSSDSRRGPRLLRIASTTASGRFAASQAIASAPGRAVALAVSPGGRVLIVNYGGAFYALAAYERAPGASASVPVAIPASAPPNDIALALEDDGGAVIAYRSDATATFALLRRPGGTFGHEQLMDGQRSNGFSLGVGSGIDFGPIEDSHPTPPDDAQGARLVAALGADGHVLVTWLDPSDARNAMSAHTASGTLGGLSHAMRLGSPCRDANGARPLTLADGTLGASWTDNARVDSQDIIASPLAGGLLHVVVPGTAAPAATTTPGFSARLVGPRALHGGDALHLRVRCRRGPCVVRAFATTHSLDPSYDSATQVARSIVLNDSRSSMLQLDGIDPETFARPNGAPATISLVACSTEGTGVTHLTLHERLRRLPLRPLPRILDLVARRRGNGIRVTWRTADPARGASFEITARPADPAKPIDVLLDGHGRSHFSVTLHGSSSQRERAVSIDVSNGDQPQDATVTARIR